MLFRSAQKEVIDYPDTMVDNMKAYMAVPTAEEKDVYKRQTKDVSRLKRR